MSANQALLECLIQTSRTAAAAAGGGEGGRSCSAIVARLNAHADSSSHDITSYFVHHMIMLHDHVTSHLVTSSSHIILSHHLVTSSCTGSPACTRSIHACTRACLCVHYSCACSRVRMRARTCARGRVGAAAKLRKGSLVHHVQGLEVNG